MNKLGFTLIELLAVIALLGIITVIAVPTIGGITGSIQNKMLEEKISLIEHVSVLYGKDNKKLITSSSNDNKYNGYSCISVKVYELVPDYLEKDNDNECLENDEDIKGCIEDPKNKNNYLDQNDVIIYYKNKKIYADFVLDEEKETKKCLQG